MKQANKKYFLNMALVTVSGLALMGCVGYQDDGGFYTEPVVEDTIIIDETLSDKPISMSTTRTTAARTSSDKPVSLTKPCDYPKGKKPTPNVSVSMPDEDRFVPVKEVKVKPEHRVPPAVEVKTKPVQAVEEVKVKPEVVAAAAVPAVAYETKTTSVEIQKNPTPSRIEIEVVTPGCTDKSCDQNKAEDKWTQIALERMRLEQELADLQAKKDRLDELQRIAEEVKKAEEEARIAEEQARLAEELRKAEEEARRAEEEARRAEEEEARRAEARLDQDVVDLCPEKECDETKDWVAPQGTTLRTLLTEWGEASGWRVVWNMDRDYSLDASAVFRGQFTSVSAALLRSFARATPAPKGVFYKGNKVLVISTREDENAD